MMPGSFHRERHAIVKSVLTVLLVLGMTGVSAADQDFTIQDSNSNPLFDVDGDSGNVKIPDGNLNLDGNQINNIGGLQNCGNNEFINGNGDCTADSFESNTDTQDLSINDDTITLDRGGQITIARGSANGAVRLGPDSTTFTNAFDAVAIGSDSTALAQNAVALGHSSEVPGSGAMALGPDSTASAFNAVALGDSSTASAIGAVAIGPSSTASDPDAVALGRSSEASAQNAVAIGYRANAPNSYEATFGNLDGEELDLNVTGNLTVHQNTDLKGNLNLDGNQINNIGGLQDCGNNQFVDGSGNCETDDDRPGGNDFGNADDLDNQGNINDFSEATDLGQNGDISDSSVQDAELDLANGLTVAGGAAGDGTQNGFEVDSNGNIYFSGSLNFPGDINTVNAQEIDGSIVPETDATLNLGSEQNRYSDLYLADNIYDTSGNDPFFDGGCSEDQYITGITSTGQIQCSNEPDDTDDSVNNGELDNLFSGSGILTRTGSGTYTTTTDNVQDGDTDDTNELQDLEDVRSRDNTLGGSIEFNAQSNANPPTAAIKDTGYVELVNQEDQRLPNNNQFTLFSDHSEGLQYNDNNGNDKVIASQNYVNSNDDTIADNQDLSSTADVSGTNDRIEIAGGSNTVIDDDFEANTDNQNINSFTASGDTVSLNLENGGSASATINDNTIADNQDLSSTADVSGTNDRIEIAGGSNTVIDDDFAADNQDIQASATGDTINLNIDNGNGASATIDDDFEADTTIADNQGLSDVLSNGNSASTDINVNDAAFTIDGGASNGGVGIRSQVGALYLNGDLGIFANGQFGAQSTDCNGDEFIAGDGSCNQDSFEANTDNQNINSFTGSGDTVSLNLENGGSASATINDNTIADNQGLPDVLNNDDSANQDINLGTNNAILTNGGNDDNHGIAQGDGASGYTGHDGPDVFGYDGVNIYGTQTGQTIAEFEDNGNVDVPNGGLDVSGQLNVGSTKCGTNQFLNGNGNCETDSFESDTTIPDNQDIQASATGDTINLNIDNGNGASATINDNTIADDQNLEDVRSRDNNVAGSIDFQSSGSITSLENLNVDSINSNKGSDPVDLDQGIDLDGSNIIDDNDNTVNVNDNLDVSNQLSASGTLVVPTGDVY